MSEIAIIRALQQGVIAAVAASPTPTIPVAYLDVAFTKPDDGIWLELVHIPANNVTDYWGNRKNFRGILRLVLHWPKTGAGVYAPLGVIDDIAGYFTVGLNLSGVQISAIPDFTGALSEDNETLYGYSVRYQSYQEV